jgi:hypothetical protein
MRKESEGYTYLRQTFPKISEDDLKDVFVDRQITMYQEFSKNCILQKEGPGRFLKTSAETF